MNRLTVVAPEGRLFPMEGQPRLHIKQEPVVVENTTYYRRAIVDGDLVVVQPGPTSAKAKE